MYITQKFLKKVFAFAMLGVYTVGFGVVIGTRTHEYTRVIGDYTLVNQSKQRHLPANSNSGQVVNDYERIDLVRQDVYVYSKYNFTVDTYDYSKPLCLQTNFLYGTSSIYQPNMTLYSLQRLSSYQNYIYATSLPICVIQDAQTDFVYGRFFFPNSSVCSSIYVKFSSNIPGATAPVNETMYIGYGDCPNPAGTGLRLNNNEFLMYDNIAYFSDNSGIYQDNLCSKFSSFWFYANTSEISFNIEIWCCGKLDIDYQQGLLEGYNNGYTDGYNDGENYVVGHSSEFDLYTYAEYIAYGQQRYNQGLDEGGQVLSISAVMNTIFTAPVSMFMQIFRSGAFVWTMPTGEVLDLGGLMTFFLTIGIALAVVRLIMKVGGK